MDEISLFPEPRILEPFSDISFLCHIDTNRFFVPALSSSGCFAVKKQPGEYIFDQAKDFHR